MLLVDSLYINNSGGKVLLDYLVSELEFRNINSYYLFDSRCCGDYKNVPLERKSYIKAGLINRHNFYRQNFYKFDSVFCFGNIPPTINLPTVYTYFHNISLIKYPDNYRFKERGIKYLKKCLVKYFSKNTNYFIVQSKYVKKELCESLNISDNSCLVIPFFKRINEESDVYVENSKNKFVYISNGNTHKNHSKLLDAWEILAKENIYPHLSLTITSNFILLTNRIKELQKKGLRIRNYGFTNPIDLYKNSEYIIYPSLIESFGLGLVEGVEFGCKVIASDREYVYEVVKPTKVFDPEDPASIADAVKYVLNNDSYMSKTIIQNQIDELINVIVKNETNNTRPENR